MTPGKPAILFLMPDARLRDIYLSRFERDGWEVDSATNLVDAERRAVKLRPTILFINYEVLDDVKTAFKRFKSLPTLLKAKIVIGARALTRTQVNETLGAGAIEVVITAHITPQALVKRMNQLIEDDL